MDGCKFMANDNDMSFVNEDVNNGPEELIKVFLNEL